MRRGQVEAAGEPLDRPGGGDLGANDIGLEIGDRFPNDLFPPVPLEAGSEPPTARR